jgi:hypothetical protein
MSKSQMKRLAIQRGEPMDTPGIADPTPYNAQLENMTRENLISELLKWKWEALNAWKEIRDLEWRMHNEPK